ncbi:hypothetical protein F442_22854, partial [Phytophthora nicotianae P10297]
GSTAIPAAVATVDRHDYHYVSAGGRLSGVGYRPGTPTGHAKGAPEDVHHHVCDTTVGALKQEYLSFYRR